MTIWDAGLEKAATTKKVQVKPHVREGKPVKGYVREDEEAVPEASSDLIALRARELELWSQWKAARDNKDLAEEKRLAWEQLKSYNGMIRSYRYAGQFFTSGSRDIPPAAILFEFQKRLLEGLGKYDPSRGSSIPTWLHNYFLKAKRFVKQNQNVGRIVEERTYKIREYKTSNIYLDEQLGRPPTHDELASHLGWSVKEVGRMASELRRDVASSSFEEDPSEIHMDLEEEKLRLVQYELTPEELQVYRHTFGISGAPALPPGEIATRLKMHPSKVSRLRKRIAEKVERYL